jgi:tetraacyldisaccharide-1-P 4'-kinase/uncharacterized protein YbaR (Trm112 family)
LLASEPLDLILCDDGMQHYRLARDLELVLIDAARGLGNRRCLPAGPLREPAERLQRSMRCCSTAPRLTVSGLRLRLQPTALVNLRSGERRGSTISRRPALHAVAGIGNPQRFFNTLLGLNWQPVPHPFADHAPYSAEPEFSPPLPLVMTEKDAVKCRPSPLTTGGTWRSMPCRRRPSRLVRQPADAPVAQALSLFHFPAWPQGNPMDTKLLDILACPITKGPLKLSADKTELISKGAGLAYPIRDGIPVMLESEARTLTDDERLDK